jgi:hypothetical protein
VNDSNLQNTPPADVSSDDLEFLQRLRANPALNLKFRQIMQHLEDEIASGGDANQAEMMVIEELRGLGQAMLVHWATSSHDEAIAKSKESEPNLSNHAKKNSGGIPPSDASA